MTKASSKPLFGKLGLVPGATLALVDAPANVLELLAGMPEDVKIQEEANGCDVILLFVETLKGFPKRLVNLRSRMAPRGGLWVIYPKKASGFATDCTFEAIQAVGIGSQLVDNKICAVDAKWTAIRFVIPLALRPKTSRRKG